MLNAELLMVMQWAWRMNSRGRLREPGQPIAISSMWRLPRQLDVIDAIFERPGDGVVVIFRGRYCYCFFYLFKKIFSTAFTLSMA